MRSLLTVFLTLILLTVQAQGASAAARDYGLRYAGVEFYGSSQITKLELEKSLALKPGASLTQVDKAVERLNKKLALRHINGLVQIVQAPPDKIHIVVDIPDSVVDASAPTRRLKEPRHVLVRSEKPFILMDQLEQRLRKLSSEGRPWSERLKMGLTYYTDEPANQLVEQIIKQVPDMRLELLAVVDSDPDPNRRRRAVELMDWAGAVPETAYRLIPALDDADSGVRAAVARYLFPRLETLPDNFPFQTLVESFSRQMNRPSHQDRSKSLYCLLAICGQRPQYINGAKVFCEERVRQLAQESVVPSVKEPAEKLLDVFSKAPPPPPRQPDGQGPDQGSYF